MACPAGASAIMFAERYNKDSLYATEIFVLTTILSLITIVVNICDKAVWSVSEL